MRLKLTTLWWEDSWVIYFSIGILGFAVSTSWVLYSYSKHGQPVLNVAYYIKYDIWQWIVNKQ